MTLLERVSVAAMVGASGAALMALLNWGGNTAHDGPLLLAAAFGGATIAGVTLAGKYGRYWPVAVFASLAATVFGAGMGAFLVLLRPEALLMGPVFVTGALLDAPLALGFWVASQLAVHVGAFALRQWTDDVRGAF
jgi:hypothetical protein